MISKLKETACLHLFEVHRLRLFLRVSVVMCVHPTAVLVPGKAVIGSNFAGRKDLELNSKLSNFKLNDKLSSVRDICFSIDISANFETWDDTIDLRTVILSQIWIFHKSQSTFSCDGSYSIWLHRLWHGTFRVIRNCLSSGRYSRVLNWYRLKLRNHQSFQGWPDQLQQLITH